MGNEWMIMDGEATDGRGILLAVHVPSRQVYGAQHDVDEEVDHMASQKHGSSDGGWLGIVRKREAMGSGNCSGRTHPRSPPTAAVDASEYWRA